MRDLGLVDLVILQQCQGREAKGCEIPAENGFIYQRPSLCVCPGTSSLPFSLRGFFFFFFPEVLHTNRS